MKQDGFSYIVRAELVFTAEEAKLLHEFSQGHYDYKCKAASKQGGLIFGIGNRTATDAVVEQPVPSAYTFRQLDLLCKVCESAWHVDSAEGRQLHRRIKTVLQRVRVEQDRLLKAEAEAKPFVGEVA